VKFYADSTSSLKNVFTKVKNRYFNGANLSLAKIQYVFWEGDKKTNDGRVVRGETRIPSNRERDIYGHDFIISISGDFWDDEASPKDKIRLAYHELKHCIVVCKTSNKQIIPQEDKDGRLKVSIRPHDINLNLFLDEVEIVGLSDQENQYLEDLHMRAVSTGRKKKKGLSVKLRKK
jgi:hypothetical protein